MNATVSNSAPDHHSCRFEQHELRAMVARIQQALSPELLSKTWREQAKGEHHTFGHCYVSSEALYHLLGGKAAGLKSMVARDPGGGTHWWLVDRAGQIIDPTAEQYTSAGLTPPYALGRGSGFLTAEPSKRARIVIERVGRARDIAHGV